MDDLERDGVRLHPGILSAGEIAELNTDLEALASSGRSAGVRNLLTALPRLATLASSARLRALLPGKRSWRPVRAILFDKGGTGGDWAIRWHQDLAIAVAERGEAPGFHGWSVKRGVPHVLAPIAVLEEMMALRLHLDPADEASGALRVVPGSHRLGRIAKADQARLIRERGGRLMGAAAGDALALRPLVLHRSDRTDGGHRRRVVHIEYAFRALPPPLRWYQDGRP